MKALLFISFFTLTGLVQSFAQSDQISKDAQSFMEEGFTSTEKLFNFIENRDCDLNLISECDGPMPARERELIKNLLLNVETWATRAHTELIPKMDLLGGLPVEIKKGTTFSLTKKTRFNPLRFEFEKYYQVIYAKDEESFNFIQQPRIWATANLFIYDSFFKLAHALKNAKKIRYLLEHDMPEGKNILASIYSKAINKKRWEQAKEVLELLDSEVPLRGPRRLSEYEVYFDQYIQKSFVAQRIKENDTSFLLTTEILMRRQMSEGNVMGIVERFVERVSRLFGNTAGEIQTRPGKLLHLAKDKKEMKRLKNKLKPLYIVLEKTPNRLTDKFIPGYFGHLGLWLGDISRWEELTIKYEGEIIPLLEHPEVLPHLEDFSQGKFMLEALRHPGVTLNTLEHFMDIDDLVILEAPEMDNNQMAEHLLQALRQFGKPYDFSFDVETDNAIVCSELVYTVYRDIQWPTSISLKRHTINPDHIAWKAVDSCFKTIEMYIDGKRIKTNLEQKLIERLNLPGGISYTPVGSCEKRSR